MGKEVEEGEDEGIDNDYDEAEAGDPEPGERGNMSQEGSPALTSEGYDSAHESGEQRREKSIKSVEVNILVS